MSKSRTSANDAERPDAPSATTRRGTAVRFGEPEHLELPDVECVAEAVTPDAAARASWIVSTDGHTWLSLFKREGDRWRELIDCIENMPAALLRPLGLALAELADEVDRALPGALDEANAFAELAGKYQETGQVQHPGLEQPSAT